MIRKPYPCEAAIPGESELDRRIAHHRRQIAKGFGRPHKPTRRHYQEDKDMQFVWEEKDIRPGVRVIDAGRGSAMIVEHGGPGVDGRWRPPFQYGLVIVDSPDKGMLGRAHYMGASAEGLVSLLNSENWFPEFPREII